MDPTHYTNSLFWQRFKREMSRHIIAARIVIVFITLLIILVPMVIFIRPINQLVRGLIKGPQLVGTFFTDPLYTLPSYSGRTNILFLGSGGKEHDGGDLTDTMIFISLDLKNTNTTVLSIPRDIWVESLQAKINTAYHYGEEKEKGGGFPLTEDAVYEIVGQPIHYVISVDFGGFVKLIDLIGGIDIYVDRAFTDKQYPIKGKENDACNGDETFACRYEILTFKQGLQHMDGTRALKFSRSRYAEGDEGTDFARSARQQKVIKAIKDTMSSSQFLLKPQKILELKNLAKQYIVINKKITDNEYAAFMGFAYNFWRSGKEIKTIMLDVGDDDNPGFLLSPPIEKHDQWVLEPRSGSWTDFQNYFKQILDK